MSLTPVSVRPTSAPTGLGGPTPSALLAAGVGTLSAKSTSGTATLQTLVWSVGLGAWLSVNLIAKVSGNTILPDSTKNGGVDSANFVVPASAYYCAWLTSAPPENDISNLTADVAGAAIGPSGSAVKGVDSTMSPYQVLASDQILLVDTSAGAVTILLETTPILDRAPLTLVDAAESFDIHAATVNGNGHTINGNATVVLNTIDSGLTIYWNSARWVYSVVNSVGQNSVNGLSLSPTNLLRFLSSQGHNGAGAVTVTGTKVGDKVIGIIDITDHTSLIPGTDFEATVTVINQIQQLSATDLSAKTLAYLVIAKS